jgi:predicted RNA-binding protein with PUA-like domain
VADVLVHHTGNEKSVVGVAKVIAQDAKTGVPKLKAVQPVTRPVTLAEVKADKMFSDLGLVRMGRLSVMPASPAQFRALAKLGGVSI